MFIIKHDYTNFIFPRVICMIKLVWKIRLLQNIHSEQRAIIAVSLSSDIENSVPLKRGKLIATPLNFFNILSRVTFFFNILSFPESIIFIPHPHKNCPASDILKLYYRYILFCTVNRSATNAIPSLTPSDLEKNKYSTKDAHRLVLWEKSKKSCRN